MKSLVCCLILISSTAFSQTQPATGDSLYLVTYAVGSLWNQTKKPTEQPYFKEHSAFMSKLMKEGIATFGARYSDKGMIIIKASSRTAANEIIRSDVAVINNLFLADVQKLTVFYNSYTAKPTSDH